MREMKDSGIKWIGNVPASWKLVPIRYLFRECTTKNRLGQEKTALKFTYGTIIPKTNFNANTDDYVANTIMSYTVVHPGVIMINCLNLNYDFVSQRIGLVKDYGAITSAYLAIEPNSQVLSAYATYQLKSWDAAKAFHNMGTGVRKTLDFSELGKKHFVLPTLGEQKNIVEFLDSQCSEIDAISADIQKEIETLEQYKRSVITEAVTKGLNPDVEMKDSGIEWVGNVPVHWDTIPIRYLFAECRFKNTLNQEKTALKFTYGTIIKKTNFDSDSDEYVANTMTNYTVVNPGTIMINGLNLNYDFVSQRVGLVKDRGAITSAYLAIVPGSRVVSEYANYQLKSWDYAKAFHNMGTGVRKTLDFSELGKKYFVTPSIEEQSKIVAFLDSKCKEIESIIESKKQQLTVIDSYKKSLIYEYVTGKKEVSA